jgi:uncharacterized protein (UPF0276 family)
VAIDVPNRYGILYRPEHRAALFANRERIDAIELIADHWFDARGRRGEELDLLAANFPVTLHALNTSVGTVEGCDERYLEKIANLAARVQPAWWSDHLCITRIGTTNLGAFAPLPRTREAVDVVVRNIRRIKRLVPTPFAIENPTLAYDVAGAEYDAAAFMTAIAEEADCGMLLDVENLHADQENLDHDPSSFAARIPIERVWEIHIAGGHRRGEEYVDSHQRPVPRETWDIYETVRQRGGTSLTLLEREAPLPPFTDLLDELERARIVGARRMVPA